MRNNLSLEPSVSLSVPMPFFLGMRVALTGGYLCLPLAPDYSGWTFGAHIDWKAFEVRLALE